MFFFDDFVIGSFFLNRSIHGRRVSHSCSEKNHHLLIWVEESFGVILYWKVIDAYTCDEKLSFFKCTILKIVLFNKKNITF